MLNPEHVQSSGSFPRKNSRNLKYGIHADANCAAIEQVNVYCINHETFFQQIPIEHQQILFNVPSPKQGAGCLQRNFPS